MVIHGCDYENGLPGNIFIEPTGQHFVPNLSQHLKYWATNVFARWQMQYTEENMPNMCSKQYFIPITLLIIVVVILRMVGFSFTYRQFIVHVRNLYWMIVCV